MIRKKSLFSGLVVSAALLLSACSGGGGTTNSGTVNLATYGLSVDCPTSDGWTCEETSTGGANIWWNGGAVTIMISGDGTSTDLDQAFERVKSGIPGEVLDEQEVDGNMVAIGTVPSSGGTKFAMALEVDGSFYECSAVFEEGQPETLKQDISSTCSSIRAS